MFCFAVFPLEGWQPVDIFIHALPGETLHSFTSGLAITLALDIMEHFGWRLAPTASHYLKVAQVLRPGGPSKLLSRHDSSAQALADSYTDVNSLLHFTVAFPTGVSP